LIAQLQSHGIRTRLFDVAETDASADWSVLSAEERSRALRLAPSSQAVFAAARAGLRRELSMALNMPPGAVPIEVDRLGRPRLPVGLRDDIDFNLSHAATRVAIAVSTGGRVGIDLEKAHEPGDRRIDMDGLIQEAMGPKERARLLRLDGVERVLGFYECWTRKEALLKAVGVGIGYPLREIDVPAPASDECVARGSGGDEHLYFGRRWRLATTRFTDGFVLSLAFEDVNSNGEAT
jgi:4'-phosphopantetheinyl transferase